MNNEELVAFYENKFEVLKKQAEEGPEDFREIMCNIDDVTQKSYLLICFYYSKDSLLYSSPCLFFRNGQWYKYAVYNPGPIQLNNATQLSNKQLFNFIKRNLLTRQKQIIINKFLNSYYQLNLENLNIQKTQLQIYKNLTMDSTIYNNIKILLEYNLTIDETDIAV